MKSKLCHHEKTIGMVKRLRLDSNKDINFPLRHIQLPETLNEPEVELSEINIEAMRRKTLSEDQTDIS